MAATLPTDASEHEGGDAQASAEQAKKSGRRQWSIQEGPRGILRRMRSQLAEDGCAESQLIIGKNLIESCTEGGEVDEETARLAVYWLTQASLQANVEATTLLQDCLDNNIGIYEHNYHEVRECLAMEHEEKLARGAARMLFQSLSDGNEFITSSSLGAKMQEVIAGSNDQDETQDQHGIEECKNLEERYGGERLSEEHLVSASVVYCGGRVPPVHHFVSSYVGSNSSLMLDGIFWPFRVVTGLYHSSLHFLGVVLTNLFVAFLNDLSPFKGSLLMCGLSFVFSLIGVQQCLLLLPTIISCFSFMVMLMSFAHMLLNKKRFDNFHSWSLLFSHYCVELNTEAAEERFKARGWKPYFSMFLSVIVFLGTVPLVSSKLILFFLPITFMSTILATLFVPEKLRAWQFVSLGVYAMAVTPKVHAEISEWLLAMLEGSGIEALFIDHRLDVGGYVKFHTGIGPALHLLWFGIQLMVLLFGRVSYLPAHIVSVIWCHLTIMGSSQVSDTSLLLYPVAAWSVVIFLPALLPIVGMFAPGLVFAYLSLIIGWDTQVASYVFGIVVVLHLILKTRAPKFVTALNLVMAITILIAVLQTDLILSYPETTASKLQWENYQNVCVPSEDSEAITITGCRPLQGVMVKWRGSVAAVGVASITNVPQVIVSFLPFAVRKPIQCYFGESRKRCSPGLLPNQRERCQLVYSVLGSECTLDNWNEYIFDIKVEMTSSMWDFGTQGPRVSLKADNIFKNFVLGLSLEDEVEFVGSLTTGLGTHQPSISLSSISCINCKNNLPNTRKANVNTMDVDYIAVPSFIFNFFLGPTLTV